MLTRRTFLAGIAAATAISSLGRANQAKYPPGRYVDMHTHLGQTWNSTEVLTAMLEDYARPRPMTAEEREAFLTTVFEASGW